MAAATRDPRRVGACAALVLWVPIALAFLLSTRDPDVRYVALGIAGAIMSSLIGWWLGPTAARSSGIPYALATAFASVAVLGGSVLWAALFVIFDRQKPADTLGFALVGLIFLGIPLLAVGFNLALLWAAIVRRTSRSN